PHLVRELVAVPVAAVEEHEDRAVPAGLVVHADAVDRGHARDHGLRARARRPEHQRDACDEPRDRRGGHPRTLAAGAEELKPAAPRESTARARDLTRSTGVLNKRLPLFSWAAGMEGRESTPTKPA